MNRRPFLVALAGGLALLAAACGGGAGDDDDDGRFATGDGFAGAATSAPGGNNMGVAPQASDRDDSSSEATGGGGGSTSALGQLDRKIIFTAEMRLTAEDVGGAFNRASTLARANGGYIGSSSFSNPSEPDRRSANLTIRVPVANYESLLASLRGMDGVTVHSEGSNSTEVTEQYTDLSSRLRNLERTEQQYLDLLAKATTIDDILTVQDRLSGVREQIEQIQGRLNVLDDMTDFATIDITLSPVAARAEEPKSGPPSLAEAWESSWERSLEIARYAAAAGVVIAVTAAWLIVPLALVIIVGRRFISPRRSEA